MNLTLFENHFHEFRPGSRPADEEPEMPGEPTEEETGSDGRGAAGAIALSLGLSAVATVAAYLLARRVRARREALAAERHEVEVRAAGYANDISE